MRIARKPRLEVEGGLYHLITRGVDRRDIFHSPEDHLKFLSLLAAQKTVGGVQSWEQAFLYDRYGNRNFDVPNTTTLGSCPATVCNPTVSTSNNRFNTGQGYTYDSAGNVTIDAEGRRFTYDAENKQTLVRAASNVTIGQYSYDGDGKRVKKTSNQENIVFVYNAAGKLIEEYSGSTLQTAYVYAGARLLTTETSAGTNYLTNDNLGSPRINTDQSGGVTARHDYMPFGEEIFAYGGRTAGLDYAADIVRKQFTGYERDNETDLDFAQARMYTNDSGRFTTTDPSRKSSYPVNPQTWNRYSYCYNNPLVLTDGNGKWPTWVHNRLIDRAFPGLSRADRQLIKEGSKSVDRRRDKSPYIIRTRNPENAHEHSTRQEGVSLSDGQEKTDRYVREKLGKAQKDQRSWESAGGWISRSALFTFGEASHPLEDFSSPAHGPWGVYSIPTQTYVHGSGETGFTFRETSEIDFDAWLVEEAKHYNEENYEPSDEEAHASLVRMRAAFLIAFGDEKFEHAVRNARDRQEAYDYLRSIGYME